MSNNSDRHQIRNNDLVLKVSTSIDRNIWNEDRYEGFLEELTLGRKYQIEAIQTALRYLLGKRYITLTDLLKENFKQNPNLEKKYGTLTGAKKRLQFTDKLAASLDLATGTGKSYVLYGIAMVMLAEGIVDQVLVLCSSTTIEAGLLEKFRELAGRAELRDLLPSDSKVVAPSIIGADQTIVPGSICIENYHAILEQTNSSVRDSLLNKGATTLILNDEAHHVANDSRTKVKKWKEFLQDSDFAFNYIIGVSGTCYVNNDYFADVIYRYSLRQAMEENYVKLVKYVAEMPKSSEPDEHWQLVYNYHEQLKTKLLRQNIRPLSIIITKTIEGCKDTAEELKAFLLDHTNMDSVTINERVLVVYNNAPDVFRLPYVDTSTSQIEWIVSVSMLNEGWDVKRVFQIVPHEQRAFNSKLLIAQVLGRGLRYPTNWQGPQPEVTVFNHDAWASSIKHLVDEVLEIERRLTARVDISSTYHFELHQLNYALETTSVKKSQPTTPTELFGGKDYIELVTDVSDLDVRIEFERAGSDERNTWKTHINKRVYTAKDIALVMYQRLLEAQDPNDPNEEMRTYYTDEYPLERLEEIVVKSLKNKGMDVATDTMRQKFLRALGSLHRGESTYARYASVEDDFFTIPTSNRQSDSVSASELRSNKVFYWTELTQNTLDDEQVEFFTEVIEPGSLYRNVQVDNRFDFKTPLVSVIADSENERRFINELLRAENHQYIQSWIKSTSSRFYEIDFAWRKGDHPKRGKFSPDFFIKLTSSRILIIEIKDDTEIQEPDLENIAKNKYALDHFGKINKRLDNEGSDVQYQFHFLTPRDYSIFFQKLRDEDILGYRSQLDDRLAE